MSPLGTRDLTPAIGFGTVLGPNVFIGPGVTIGANCVIQPGAVIGADGFGYQRGPDGSWVAKPHEFGVVIGDNVHIGANTCVDRGSWRDTEIHTGARIDNLVHVAHNAIVRENAVLVAQAEISGSVEIGEGAWVGPRACVMQRLTVGARALVGIGSVVLKDVPADQTWAGTPARCINFAVGVRESM